MSEPVFSHALIVGLGQMGASLGLALRRGGLVHTISGYDLHPDHSATALSIEAIDHLAPTLEQAAPQADLIILCTPVGAYAGIVQVLQPLVRAGAIVTDIGSIKAQAIRDITPYLPAETILVPSHPIAGSEQVGPQHARADFFDRHLFLITPVDERHEDAITRIGELWRSTGAAVEVMSAELHDQIYAYMSHLPQLLAFAAAPVLDTVGMRVSGDDTLFKRFVRIGRSDPEMWHDIMLENADNIVAAAAQLRHVLAHMQDELRSGTAGAELPAAEQMPRLVKQAWPKLLASALVNSVQLAERQFERKLARYAAGGFIDVSCPATESPEPDLELVSQYASFIADLLAAYLSEHDRIIGALEAGDAPALLSHLATAQASAKRLIATVH